MKVFNNIRGVLLDINGVLFESGAPTAIKGSVKAIQKLKNGKIPFRLVTNETVNTRKDLVQRLHSLGYTDIQSNDIFSPAPLVAKVLKQRNWRPFLLVHPELLPEFSGIDTSEPNCVVVGDADEHFTYKNVNEAFRVLHKAENPVILTMGKGYTVCVVFGSLIK